MIICIVGACGTGKTSLIRRLGLVVTSPLSTPGYLLKLASETALLVIDDAHTATRAYAAAMRKASKITNLIIIGEFQPRLPIDVLVETWPGFTATVKFKGVTR